MFDQMTPSSAALVKSLTCGAALLALLGSTVPQAQADEHLFGWVRGAETLPDGHFDAYQFITLRTGKAQGHYRAWDFNTEVEYGVTDQLQLGVAVEQHYFDIDQVDELDDQNRYQFGGVELSAKYRVLSPFKDVVGLALRLELSYLAFDDVAGIEQEEFDIQPEIILHKNFFDDTLITHLNIGAKMAFGKKPAEEYDYELTFQGGAGVAYRFAPNWFVGIEGHWRSEFPEADLGFHEHSVIFVGPSLHYGAKNWWATASYGYQVYGEGVDEPVSGKTYAEEARNEFRLKVGLNF
jgi:opacity protein-like surface antigen